MPIGAAFGHLFSSREGGVSEGGAAGLNIGTAVGDDPDHVRRNREILAARAGVASDRLVWMSQVHSATVRRVGRSDVGTTLPATDGIVTTEPGVVLAVGAADCVPVLAVDPVGGVVAAVHAGRVGAADGIAVRMLEEMTAAGAEPGRIRILLGPAICGRCYEVPPAMQQSVGQMLPGSASTTATGSTGLDLRAGLERQLNDAGVMKVDIDSRCTAEESTLFSHRRDAPTGRQAGVIWLTADGIDSTRART